MPFLLLTVGALELAIVHLTRSSISHAVSESYRPIYTGAQRCATVESVKTMLCENVSMASLESCKTNMKVRLEPLSSYSATPTTVGQFNSMSESVSSGAPEQIMLMRIYYQYNFLAPLVDKALGGGEGSLILAENIVFRTEPFGASAPCP